MIRMHIRYPLPDALSMEVIEALELLQERLFAKEQAVIPRKSKRHVTPWTPVRRMKEDPNDKS